MVGMYVHIPFCKSKCNYCDFYSITNQELIDKFCDALAMELYVKAENNVIDTIFFGGGTASLLSEKQFKLVAQVINNNYNFGPNCEWSIEVNPESFDDKKALMWYNMGVSRLSIGVQSLNDNELKLCSRLHDSKTSLSVLNSEVLSIFSSVNVDLIFGLAEQTQESLLKTINQILEIKSVKHISLYELTISENTLLGKNKSQYNFASDDDIANMHKMAISLLKDNGFERYEVSNFARKGYRCMHNENYWNCRPYLGLGPGAHSYDGKRKRTANILDVEKYCEKAIKRESTTGFVEKLSKQQIKIEFLMLRLRTKDGFYLSEFNKKFKCDFIQDNKDYIESLLNNNHCIIKKDVFMLSSKGIDFADAIAAKLE